MFKSYKFRVYPNNNQEILKNLARNPVGFRRRVVHGENYE